MIGLDVEETDCTFFFRLKTRPSNTLIEIHDEFYYDIVSRILITVRVWRIEYLWYKRLSSVI